MICTWRTHLRSYLESNFDVVNVRMEVFDMVEQMCADPLGKRGNSTLKLQRHTRKSSILRKLLFFQLLTGCPNKFGIMFWSLNMNVSEASIVYDSYEKIVLCSKKLLFQPYFLSCKIENGFLTQLFSIFLCSDLFSKMEKSCFKKPFSILQFRK